LQVFGNVIGRECFHIHLNQGDKRASEIWEFASAAVNDRARCYNDSAMVAHDLDCLLHTAATRHDILRHDETLAGFDFEPPAQNESAIAVFLDEDVSFAKMAGDFLPDDDASHCWRDDRFSLIGAEFFREHAADLSSNGCVLQEQCTLEKFTTVKAAPQNKVAMKESSRLFEEIKNAWHVKWAVG
jgi:hypothetical protein